MNYIREYPLKICQNVEYDEKTAEGKVSIYPRAEIMMPEALRDKGTYIVCDTVDDNDQGYRNICKFRENRFFCFFKHNNIP